MIRVVHGEDSVLIREGVSRILAGAPDLELVGTAEDFDGLRALVEETQPDVVVTDIRMPPTQTDEGIRMAVELNEARPEIGVVVLSQHLSKAHASLVFSGGARGRAYVLKDRIADPDELVKIIRNIAGGEAYLDPLILTEVVSGSREADRSGLNMLSPREQEVLALLAAGQSNAAIARRLDVSRRAVERHVGSIFAKLGLEDGPEVSRRVQATRQPFSAKQNASARPRPLPAPVIRTRRCCMVALPVPMRHRSPSIVARYRQRRGDCDATRSD